MIKGGIRAGRVIPMNDTLAFWAWKERNEDPTWCEQLIS
jgi:hypothetical protein